MMQSRGAASSAAGGKTSSITYVAVPCYTYCCQKCMLPAKPSWPWQPRLQSLVRHDACVPLLHFRMFLSTFLLLLLRRCAREKRVQSYQTCTCAIAHAGSVSWTRVRKPTHALNFACLTAISIKAYTIRTPNACAIPRCHLQKLSDTKFWECYKGVFRYITI